MDILFYECQVCGNVILKVIDSGMVPRCCGRDMEKCVAGLEGGSKEHHIPVCKREGDIVRVCIGKEQHPIEDKHYICWIGLKTSKGIQIKNVLPGEKPEACFALAKDEEPEEAYAFCNIHKFWASKCELGDSSQGQPKDMESCKIQNMTNCRTKEEK